MNNSGFLPPPKIFWSNSDIISDKSWQHFVQGNTVELGCADQAKTQLRTELIMKEPHRKLGLWSLEHIRVIYHELLKKRGICLIRGLAATGTSVDHCAEICQFLGRSIGSLVPQNVSGDLIRKVRASPNETLTKNDSVSAQGHRGNSGMGMHSDSADIVGLFCIRKAKSGGTSSVVCSTTVYNQFVKIHSDLTKVMERGFFFDMTGKILSGVPVSKSPLPIFQNVEGGVACTYNRKRIESGMAQMGIEISNVQRKALDAFDQISNDPRNIVRIDLKPGDFILLNNCFTLHARDPYEDFSDFEKRRLLLRIWVNFTHPSEKNEKRLP